MNSRLRWIFAVIAVLLVVAAFWFFTTPAQTPAPVAPVASTTPVKPTAPAVALSQPRPPVPPPTPPPQIGPTKPRPPPAAPSVAASAAPGVVPLITDEQRTRITNNLRQLFSAAQQYMLDKSQSTASYYDLVGSGTDYQLHVITPAAGEDYSGITVSQTMTEVPVFTPSGETVIYSQ
jgi:hypothetical protein